MPTAMPKTILKIGPANNHPLRDAIWRGIVLSRRLRNRDIDIIGLTYTQYRNLLSDATAEMAIRIGLEHTMSNDPGDPVARMFGVPVIIDK